ncbi:hypothetical protein PARMER_00036 [Parabacteroides merdae ATCC 43184]|nr:hypothetical protein PARMER_00036 [Parabacteroides merdae ATCC 43184]
MTQKAHKDNPAYFSGYMSDNEAHFFILKDYHLVI